MHLWQSGVKGRKLHEKILSTVRSKLKRCCKKNQAIRRAQQEQFLPYFAEKPQWPFKKEQDYFVTSSLTLWEDEYCKHFRLPFPMTVSALMR